MKIDLEEKVVNEITNFIGDNIRLYLNISDEYFNKLQKYLVEHKRKKDNKLSYDTLLILTEEILYELYHNCYKLYDFRENM